MKLEFPKNRGLVKRALSDKSEDLSLIHPPTPGEEQSTRILQLARALYDRKKRAICENGVLDLPVRK
jgi:hypothetical protein